MKRKVLLFCLIISQTILLKAAPLEGLDPQFYIGVVLLLGIIFIGMLWISLEWWRTSKSRDNRTYSARGSIYARKEYMDEGPYRDSIKYLDYMDSVVEENGYADYVDVAHRPTPKNEEYEDAELRKKGYRRLEIALYKWYKNLNKVDESKIKLPTHPKYKEPKDHNGGGANGSW